MFDKEYVKVVFKLYEEKKTAHSVAFFLDKGKEHVFGILKNYDRNTGAPLNRIKRDGSGAPPQKRIKRF